MSVVNHPSQVPDGKILALLVKCSQNIGKEPAYFLD
jgi:hypothetical protein